MKILNLYTGIGGNRKLWGDEHEITAVEYKPEIAKIYQDFFPKDKVIIADAHQYLLEHFEEYDFIWSSPPCPSHSRARFWGSFGKNRSKIYPDMSLYQEIIFLQHYSYKVPYGKKIKWVVENVKPYYEPLIKAQKIGRHLFWSNFLIKEMDSKTMFSPKDSLPKLQEIYGIDLKHLKGEVDKRVILRNCVEPEIGKQILDYALNPIETQANLFP